MNNVISLHEYAGIVLEVKSPTEFLIDCSCWLCDEFGTIRCRQPHGLNLNTGEWVLVKGGPIYNFERVYSTGNYTYIWVVDAATVSRWSKEDEIRRLQEAGKTDCGWYHTLTNTPP